MVGKVGCIILECSQQHDFLVSFSLQVVLQAGPRDCLHVFCFIGTLLQGE